MDIGKPPFLRKQTDSQRKPQRNQESENGSAYKSHHSKLRTYGSGNRNQHGVHTSGSSRSNGAAFAYLCQQREKYYRKDVSEHIDHHSLSPGLHPKAFCEKCTGEAVLAHSAGRDCRPAEGNIQNKSAENTAEHAAGKDGKGHKKNSEAQFLYVLKYSLVGAKAYAHPCIKEYQ